jgi:hypothetical protein
MLKTRRPTFTIERTGRSSSSTNPPAQNGEFRGFVELLEILDMLLYAPGQSALSTTSAAPLTQLDASLARKPLPALISAGCPNRPNGRLAASAMKSACLAQLARLTACMGGPCRRGRYIHADLLRLWSIARRGSY